MIRNQEYILLSVIFLFTILPFSDGIKCYKCTMTAPSTYSNETIRLCSNFDYTDRYIVDCKYSTLCMKKDFTVNLTTPINGTVRDCAHQRYEYQNYSQDTGKWETKISIEEPYSEGCSARDDKGFRSSKTQFCYCRGDLCNGASTTHFNTKFLIISVIWTFKFAYSII